jgi:hypothetical protein
MRPLAPMMGGQLRSPRTAMDERGAGGRRRGLELAEENGVGRGWISGSLPLWWPPHQWRGEGERSG